jgi:hypothetical protein
MKPNKPSILDVRMDMYNMLEYRKVIQAKADKAYGTSNMGIYSRLQKQLDIMDMTFDAIWIATMTDMAPQLIALTGRDFDIPSLKLILPQLASTVIADDTQIQIQYVEETEIVEDTPVPPTSDFMKEVERLMSKDGMRNIPRAIKVYSAGIGKELYPADAYSEIKTAFPNIKPIQVWDAHIATQYRVNGPVAAYNAIKKWVPKLTDVEISRFCEDALKRTIVSPSTPFSTAKVIEELLTAGLDKGKMNLWKKKEESRNVFESYYGKQDEKTLSHGLGRIIATMTPSIRVQIEQKHGRKPYMEQGY